LDLERSAWKALTTSGEVAAKFYDGILAKEVLVLLPGMAVDRRSTVVDSMHQADWTSFELSDERVLDLTEESAVVAYRVEARRADGSRYEALLNSTYVQEGGDWKLALHQQTPA
jgi:hypothetical protein